MQVDFHILQGDIHDYVCRLVRKAVRQVAHVCITGDEPSLRRTSRALWQSGPTDFLAHAGDWDAPQVQSLSSIRLHQDPRVAPAKEVLINVGNDNILSSHAGYARVIEIIDGNNPSQVQQGRARWKQYQAQGYHPKLHNRTLQASS